MKVEHLLIQIQHLQLQVQIFQIATGDIIIIEKEMLFVSNVSTNNLTIVRGHTGLNANTDPVGTSSSTQEANSFSVGTSHADGTLVRLAKGNATATDDFVGWSQASSITACIWAEIRTWSHDNFGEDLLINPRDGLFITGINQVDLVFVQKN